jgi:spore coat polysaccharide biosynthesis protein SpsF
MVAGGFIVCRLDSQRLAGKVLRRACGRPLLAWVLERVQGVEAISGRLVVATTSRPVDDPIVAYAEGAGYPVFRGDAEDVAGRLLACARAFECDWFYRINADSPFVEPSLLAEAWQVAARGGCDFVTNLLPRSYPYGVSVELIRTEAFERAYRQMTDSADREHVTRFLYRNIDAFRYVNLAREGRDLSALRLTVDTPKDCELFTRAVEALGDRWSEVSYLDAVAFYEQARVAG